MNPVCHLVDWIQHLEPSVSGSDDVVWIGAQTNGFASVVLCSAMKRLMAACRSTTEWNTPSLSLRRVSLAKMRRIRKRSGFEQGPIDPGDQLACEWFSRRKSTAFSQDDDVGMKWNVHRGCRASQARPLECLWVQ